MKDLSFLKQSLIAHRGYHNILECIPENSMLAFKEAIKNNLIIELDVHILKDKSIVVFHDDNLKRMTGVNKLIKNFTYSEIKDIKLQDTKETIPLLNNVLKLINGKVPVIIEIKVDQKVGLLESELIKILDNYNGKYAVKSFNPFSINYIRKKRPNIVRGQLASNFKKNRMSRIKKLFLGHMLYNFITKPDFISYDIRALPNKKISKLRNNKVILGWTIRSEEDLEKAKKYCDNYICENINLNKHKNRFI